MRWKNVFLLGLIGILSPVETRAADVRGLSHPESVAVDPESGDYYISNIGGSPTEKDNDGYISRVAADGLATVLKFITARDGVVELHAPKGLAVSDGILYAVDIDAVKAFNLKNGEPTGTIDLKGFEPKFLNDIAADPKGRLYVSDMLANRILRIDAKDGFKTGIFKEDAALDQPNGLIFNPRTRGLIVATWKGGRLLEIDPDGRLKVLRTGLEAGFDGLAVDRAGTLYLSNYERGEIYRIENWGRGALSLFQSGLKTPADITYDPARHEILVPLMSEDAVTSFAVAAPSGNRSRTPPEQ